MGWLLIRGTEKKVRMKYLNESWLMPVIRRRTPFHTTPRYETLLFSYLLKRNALLCDKLSHNRAFLSYQ
ncbi:hypothetical protein D1839_09580 [Roseburia sp. 1XD42-34]|nr:hypothetical protein [Roseburia sp. 1XD42-34]RKI78082.1 hypothetical protein D7V87_09570 [Clostridium sp. 1xD42-85]